STFLALTIISSICVELPTEAEAPPASWPTLVPDASIPNTAADRVDIKLLLLQLIVLTVTTPLILLLYGLLAWLFSSLPSTASRHEPRSRRAMPSSTLYVPDKPSSFTCFTVSYGYRSCMSACRAKR